MSYKNIKNIWSILLCLSIFASGDVMADFGSWVNRAAHNTQSWAQTKWNSFRSPNVSGASALTGGVAITAALFGVAHKLCGKWYKKKRVTNLNGLLDDLEFGISCKGTVIHDDGSNNKHGADGELWPDSKRRANNECEADNKHQHGQRRVNGKNGTGTPRGGKPSHMVHLPWLLPLYVRPAMVAFQRDHKQRIVSDAYLKERIGVLRSIFQSNLSDDQKRDAYDSFVRMLADPKIDNKVVFDYHNKGSVQNAEFKTSCRLAYNRCRQQAEWSSEKRLGAAQFDRGQEKISGQRSRDLQAMLESNKQMNYPRRTSAEDLHEQLKGKIAGVRSDEPEELKKHEAWANSICESDEPEELKKHEAWANSICEGGLTNGQRIRREWKDGQRIILAKTVDRLVGSLLCPDEQQFSKVQIGDSLPPGAHDDLTDLQAKYSDVLFNRENIDLSLEVRNELRRIWDKYNDKSDGCIPFLLKVIPGNHLSSVTILHDKQRISGEQRSGLSVNGAELELLFDE